jgi:small subunit ribosomal protein S17
MSPAEDNRNVVTKIGTVRSDKMDKTIVVSIERRLLHPLYKKYIKRYTKLVAHDESNEAKVGDTVEVRFTRPISKNKRWRLEKVLVVADGGGAA